MPFRFSISNSFYNSSRCLSCLLLFHLYVISSYESLYVMIVFKHVCFGAHSVSELENIGECDVPDRAVDKY